MWSEFEKRLVRNPYSKGYEYTAAGDVEKKWYAVHSACCYSQASHHQSGLVVKDHLKMKKKQRCAAVVLYQASSLLFKFWLLRYILSTACLSSLLSQLVNNEVAAVAPVIVSARLSGPCALIMTICFDRSARFDSASSRCLQQPDISLGKTGSQTSQEA